VRNVLDDFGLDATFWRVFAAVVLPQQGMVWGAWLVGWALGRT
jgi:hypothetical protein